MNRRVKNAFLMAGLLIATQAVAQVTFYEGRGFEGRSFTTQKRVGNFERYGFNDRASSAIVMRDRWEVCEDARFNGRCVVLRPGRYPTLAAMGLNDRVSSVRMVKRDKHIEDNQYAPEPFANRDFRKGRNERLYEAEVVSVRAVVGPPEQRCWVEQEQVVAEQRDNSLPGTIAGAVIGGILGHQVGGGRGQDLATAGGAVAGAVFGGSIGRNSGGAPAATRDVRRCENVPRQARADFWDVTYRFRGAEHYMQMTRPPGATITVNDRGEPRV